jgi:hypothetical protein
MEPRPFTPVMRGDLLETPHGLAVVQDCDPLDTSVRSENGSAPANN